LALKVIATNAITGKPEANVTIVFTPAGSQLKVASNIVNAKIVKKTAAGGGANIKNLPDGNYDYIAKKPGCKDVYGTISVVNGEMTVLEIKIEKS
jgi:hypothetical protein